MRVQQTPLCHSEICGHGYPRSTDLHREEPCNQDEDHIGPVGPKDSGEDRRPSVTALRQWLCGELAPKELRLFPDPPRETVTLLYHVWGRFSMLWHEDCQLCESH